MWRSNYLADARQHVRRARILTRAARILAARGCDSSHLQPVIADALRCARIMRDHARKGV